MRIIMQATYATPTVQAGPGAVVDLPKREAETLISRGYAVAAADPTPRVTENPTGPPSGPTRKIMEWVDGDPEKAQVALDVEMARPKPRTNLVAALRHLLDDDGSSSERADDD